MEVFQALLSTEILAGILIVGSFALAIRSTLGFTRQAAELRPKLDTVERELRRLREGMGERRKAVDKLNKLVTPIRKTEAQMREYYEEIQQLKIESEKRQQQEGEQQEANRRRRIQRKKMGFEAP